MSAIFQLLPRIAFSGPYRRNDGNHFCPAWVYSQFASWPAGGFGPKEMSTLPSGSSASPCRANRVTGLLISSDRRVGRGGRGFRLARSGYALGSGITALPFCGKQKGTFGLSTLVTGVEEDGTQMPHALLPPIPDGATQINDLLSVVRQKGKWTYFLGVQPVFGHD